MTDATAGVHRGAREREANTWISRFTHAQRRRLPLPVPMRWWQETDYSLEEPSAELDEAVKGAPGCEGSPLIRSRACRAGPGTGEHARGSAPV